MSEYIIVGQEFGYKECSDYDEALREAKDMCKTNNENIIIARKVGSYQVKLELYLVDKPFKKT